MPRTTLQIRIDAARDELARIEAGYASGTIHEGNAVWEQLGRLQSALKGLIEAVEE